jgi:hypothetical protein
MARPLLVLAVSLACANAAGCGNERAKVPDTQSPDAPRGERVDRYAKAGIRFTAPGNWPQIAPQGLRVGGIQSKRATLAIWRYARTEPLPKSEAELKRVETLLVERVKQRDPSFTLKESRRRRRGGARAIELVGRQTAAGLPFGVRSSHIYIAGHEIVFDAYAPPEHFDRVDETVFVPVLDSLKLTSP